MPLGFDMQWRRYWALGPGLASWRVYVQEHEGSLWGWYEGVFSTSPDLALPVCKCSVADSTDASCVGSTCFRCSSAEAGGHVMFTTPHYGIK